MAASLILLSVEITFIFATGVAGLVLGWYSNRHNDFDSRYFYPAAAALLVSWISLFYFTRYRFRRYVDGDQFQASIADLVDLKKEDNRAEAALRVRDRIVHELPALLTAIYILATLGIWLIFDYEPFDLATGIFLITVTAIFTVIMLWKNGGNDYRLLKHIKKNILASRALMGKGK